MKIYVTHSRGKFDFRDMLYIPLRGSILDPQHEIIFPHEFSDEPYDSRPLMATLGLFVAEVTYPSTGLGIELGVASERKVPIVCFCQLGHTYPRSVDRVTNVVYMYSSSNGIIDLLTEHIAAIQGH